MTALNLKNIYNNNLRSIGILFAIVVLTPFIASEYVLAIFTMIGLYSLICIGLTMLTGYAGQISLGHAAFYGIGAYTTAYLTGSQGMPPILALLIGAVLSAIIALVIGLPAFKLKGYYLALATLGFGIIVYTLFKELTSITGGANGFFGIPSMSLFGFQFVTETHYFYLVWAIVMLALLFTRNILHSRVGRGLRSIEGSEIAADAVGVNLMKYKLQIFVLSAIFASVAGSLLAHYVSFINPDLFTADTSIFLLIMVIIGGSTSLWGAIVGASTYVLLGEFLKHYMPIIMPSIGGEFEILFFGVLLVTTLIYMPDGLMPKLKKLAERIKPATIKGGTAND